IAEQNESDVWDSPIVTEVTQAPAFFPAEEEHRDYYRRNPGQPYCQAVIAPKLAKLRKLHFDRLKGGSTDRSGADGQVRPYQSDPRSPMDQGGISD
ncbi:MAG: peptide-methionine (S)-S-oxide reductase, partial [Gemmatimonadota bacterium]